MRRSLWVFFTMLLAGGVVIAWAQDVKPDRAIKFRQGILQAQGWNAGIMNAATRAMSSATIAQRTMRSGRSQMRSGTADGCCAVMHSL